MSRANVIAVVAAAFALGMLAQHLFHRCPDISVGLGMALSGLPSGNHYDTSKCVMDAYTGDIKC